MLARGILVLVVVVAVAVALALAFALSTLLRRRRTAACPAPLPPVQGLAHHRKRGYPHSLSVPAPAFHLPHRPASASSLASSQDSAATPTSHKSRRPLSIASHSTLSAPRQSTLRGTPHGPHSQLHIVLPAPLHAPTTDKTENRKSSADQWLAAALRE